MNKKFTMVCASLLLASAFSVNAADAVKLAANSPEIVTYQQNDAIEISEGVKFYLRSTANYKVASLETADGKNVVTLGTTTTNVSDASVFEIRNAQKNGAGYIVELYVGGKPFVTKGNAEAETTDNYTQLNNKFFIDATTTDFTGLSAVNGGSILEGYSAARLELDYNAVNLSDFNKEATTFSFDFTDNELVGNLFKELTPVTFGGATYFVKGAKAAEFAEKVSANEDYSLIVDDIKDKGLQILAIDHKSNYGLNSSKDGEGLKLRMVDAEKFLLKEDKSSLLDAAQSDSLTLAGFTSILEADQLNNAKELVLTMSPKDGLLGTNVTADFNIAAVKTSATDTKAYVTTVMAGVNASSWAVVKNALLGDNTYFAASEFLKEGMRAVALLNVGGTYVAGDDNYNENYSKYFVGKNSTELSYAAGSNVDFELPQNQWVITGFDGKYQLTLKNRLDNTVLTISSISKTEKGYKGTFSYASVTESVEFKFVDLATTKTDGYLALTDDQVKKGFKLSFSGKTALAGDKDFYASLDGTALVPSLKSSDAYTIKVKKNDEVKQELSYIYLKDGVKTSAKDVLVVPTYSIQNTEGEDVTEPNVTINSNSIIAFAKNANAGYSLVSLASGEADDKHVGLKDAEVLGVIYNTENTDENTTGLKFAEFDRYIKSEVVANFANVNVLPNVVLNASLPAVPGHYTFDNERGSVNVKDLVGINEGFLASEGQVFWLDTADIEKEIPSFYISFGNDTVAARNYMYNAIDSAKVFDNYTATYKYNKEYYYGEVDPAVVEGGEASCNLKVAYASTVAEEGKDLADAFKFNITLKDAAVADEYVISSVKDEKYVGQKNGVVILVDRKDDAMAFTVNPAEAPTSNETVSASEVKVVANNGSVVVKNAAGKNVVVSTILGQVVANEVLTSDNATINVPAGIVVVAVDGESFKVNVK